MIIEESVRVKIYPQTKQYYEEKLNISLHVGDIVDVNVKLLPPKSGIHVQCQCDSCGELYSQRFYRDHSVCGKCKMSKRLTGNSYSKKTEDIPKKSTLEDMINSGKGKQEISRSFGITISILNRWLKHHKLTMTPYIGLKSIKNPNIEQDIITYVENLPIEEKLTISSLSSKFGLTRTVAKNIIKKNPQLKQKIHTTFDIFAANYDMVNERLDFYIAENNTKSLNVIADENKISIEQLKKCFRSNEIPVKIHSYNKSKGELEVREFIRELGSECQSQLFDKKFEIDCYVADHQFGVEYCGEYWHRFDQFGNNNKNRHLDKLKFFKEKGVKLFTIFENEWLIKRPIIESMIRYRVNHHSIRTIYARKCILKEIDKASANEFHKTNHIHGYAASTFNFGLYCNDELVSVLSLIKSRFDKSAEYEIARFSSTLNTSVVGGFSKLFNFFTIQYNPNSCVTYADRRFGEGETYLNNCFQYMTSTKPNYWYYDKTTATLENRMKYQKSKLKTLFPMHFSETKTEFEIMTDAGYFKVYDCGSNKYIWKK